MALRVGTLVSPAYSGAGRAWIPREPEEGALPAEAELLVGAGPVDEWLVSALEPFAESFTQLWGGTTWLASTHSACAATAVDALRFCGQDVSVLSPAQTSALWKVEGSASGPVLPPGLEPPPGLGPPPGLDTVAWPPGLPASQGERPGSLSVVLLGPTRDASESAVRSVVAYAGLAKHLLGSVSVGSEHRAVALLGEAPGWLLLARAPTAGLTARVMAVSG